MIADALVGGRPALQIEELLTASEASDIGTVCTSARPGCLEGPGQQWRTLLCQGHRPWGGSRVGGWDGTGDGEGSGGWVEGRLWENWGCPGEHSCGREESEEKDCGEGAGPREICV